MKKETFIYTEEFKLSDIVAQVFGLHLNRYGYIVCIQNISVVDLVSVPTRTDIGVLRGSSFDGLKSYVPASAGFIVAYENPVYMFIDDQPACNIVGGTLNDRIKITITGYVLYDNKDD